MGQPVRYKAVVAYDGTDFAGWQRQPGLRTVQETFETALSRLSRSGQSVTAHASGRTDAGVHARGQTVHFDLFRDMTGPQLRRALNGWLPEDVRVVDAAAVSSDFHARHSAAGKEYRYFVYNAAVMDPLFRRTMLHMPRELNMEAMREAASLLTGKHDFAAFSANPSREIESTVRTVYSIEIAGEAPFLEFRVTGDGFLYKMVRSISGILLSVGIGKERPGAVREIMLSGVRTARVETAPARGLVLWRVWYERADVKDAVPFE